MMETLRRFGPQYCDVETMLWNVSVMLRGLTLNIDRRNKKPIPIIVYIISISICLGYFYVYLVSMSWFVFHRCQQTGDLLAAIIVFSLGVSSEIGTVKLIFMFLHIGKVRRIVSECLACDALVVAGSRFSANLLSTLTLVKKRALVFWVVIIGNGVVYVVKPIMMPGRHFTEDKFILYGLEPMVENPNYQIATILSMAGVIFTCYLPANITAFLIVVTGYIEAQMLSLTEELLHLWEDAESHYYITHQTNAVLEESIENSIIRNKVINDYIESHLKDIIKTHGRNINLLHQVESVFSGAIALEFVILGVGLIAELLGGLENTYLEIPFALAQVGMDCFTGQRVMDASVKFERAVYDCKWENYSISNMKIVLMMLQSSQKTMKLSAGGIIMLSFSCLMQVFRSIYSAYTTLRSTMK
ncbi:uncharacterized protein LOC118272121 [Spodoptera frugiperda]|uniref:Odorant receptor n=3 Tax=Spodoptera frugiperda TaxID=7108 RepID=A0A9R0ET42_SPOFR|nr:uncharacterized protein LOC118272121 [Spodoptera frugiperda]